MSAARSFLALLTVGLSAQTQFEIRTPAAITAAWPLEAVAADFDGDGDLDLFGQASLLGGTPARRLLRNDGNEQFTDVSLTALPAQASVFFSGKALAFDLDNDGDIDVLSSTLGAVVEWRNVGNGTFVDTGFTDPGGYTDLIASDLDGDGDVDVAASGNALAASSNTVLVNQGGTLQRQNVLPTPWSSTIALSDLDGDRDLDVLLGSVNGLVVARNDGNLVFTDVTTTWVGTLAPGTIRDLAVGDVDGDGDQDVVVSRSSTPTDDVLRNTGTAFAAGASIPTMPDGPNRFVLADVDENGTLDLLRANSAGLSLALGTGTGAFSLVTGRMPTLPSQVPGLVSADFDRDGDPDLLVAEPFWPPTLLVNRHRDLRPDQPVIGQTWRPEVWSQPGYATFPHGVILGIALFALPRPVAVPGLGDLALDPSGPLLLTPGVVLPNGAPALFPFAVPSVPVLVGVPLYVQAIVDQAPAHLSAAFSVAVR